MWFAHYRAMAEYVSWGATAATILAALMTASNLGTRITGYGFCVFLVGSLSWLSAGVLTHQPALVWTNSVLTALNIFGIWRWLGRQVRVEKGGKAAAEASEATPGEALFPVSLMCRARVECAGTDVGYAMDGLACSRSGRLVYVVVSAGGLAGVGETLRRLSWADIEVEGEVVKSRLNADQFFRLEELPKDEWPAS
jgi:hypothetical protein